MPRPPENVFLAIALKIGAVAVFVAMTTIVKSISGKVPPGEMVFFRSFFGVPVIFIWLFMQGRLRDGIKVHSPLAHLWRGTLSTAAMACGFVALSILPLSEVTSIQFAMPLFLVIMAAVFLGEQVRVVRVTAVGIGMVGVMIIMWPRLSVFRGGGADALVAAGAMLALCNAFLAALAQTTIRKMTETENSAAIVFWVSISGGAMSLVTLPFGWVWPETSTLLALMVVGLLGGTGQILLTSAFRYADASIVAPFEYTSIVFAVVLGYVFFAEVPSLNVLVGGAVVIASGGLIIFREHQLRIERAKSRSIDSRFS